MDMLKGQEIVRSVELKACVRENDADLENLTVQFNTTKCRKSVR